MDDKSLEKQVTLLFARELTGTPLASGITTGEFQAQGRKDTSPDEVFNLLIRCTSALFETVQLVAREVDELKRP
jgi:hypothetical protein